MRNLQSHREYSREVPRARLNAVWYVEADGSYSVKRKQEAQEGGYIAVRTLTGQGSMTLRGGDKHLLAPNSLGIFEMRQILNYEADEEGWQFYWFEFELEGQKPKGLNRISQIRLSAQERAELERCFMSLSRNAVYECMMAEALFSYLLADWQTRLEDEAGAGCARQTVLSLLEKGRRERLSIAQMARSAGMCERSFRDAVHEATGLSPKAYMLKGEMAAAMELLRTTDMTISEIAACFNYASPFYFSRVFKKYYGVSPQRVRDGIEL